MNARDLVTCSHTRQDRSILKTKRRHLAKEHYHNDNDTMVQYYNNCDNGIVLSGSTCMLSQAEQFTRAKILEALTCVNSNLSFASANGGAIRCLQIFPDSKIEEHQCQKETKMKYVIQYGLCPYFKALLLSIFSTRHIHSNFMNLPLRK